MSGPLPIDGLILAGGAGRRMGGADKGWLEWNGRSLVEAVLERLSPQVAQVRISANRNIDRYAALGLPVVQDLHPDYPGPLAGIEAGLRAAKADWLLCVPCDCPKLPLDLALRLWSAKPASSAAAVVSLEGRIQPVFALIHTALADSLAERLQRGERRVAAWLEAVDATAVPFADADAFANLNTPEALGGQARF